MNHYKLNIGIILGSTRQGRVSPQVGKWVKEIADKRRDATYEILDIADFKLPFVGDVSGEEQVKVWSEKISSQDGFVFIVQEYNHSITGVLKNALDSAEYTEWNNKAAGIVSYGEIGGTRAAEHLRGIFGELQIAGVRAQPTLLLSEEFDDENVFRPDKSHINTVNETLAQVNAWSAALKTVR